jgi:hypothetical protein
MNLQDAENECLLLLQQPGSNPGGAPAWPTNVPLTQVVVDFAINRGYERVLRDLNEYEIADVTFTISTTANVFKYNIVAGGGGGGLGSKAPVSMVHRIFYAPVGLNYTYEYKPGYGFISWDEYQKITNQGYDQNTSSMSTLPSFCTIDNLRQNLYFYPGSSNSSDTITVCYAGLPQGTTTIPILAAETDVPILPLDCHQAIVYYACWLLWMRIREAGESNVFKQMYDQEIAAITRAYNAAHRGDITRFDLGSWFSSPFPALGGAF